MSQDARQRWQQRYDAALAAGKVRDADFTTLSGVEVDPVYGPADESAVPGFERIGYPGEFPFTRGLHATGYRGRAWTIRQFAGFGNARQTNERYKMILAEGGGGLSVAFDMPTLMGRDSDDPRALGEVGHCGVAVDSAIDMDELFDGIPLGETTTSMTISGPAVPVFCMYLVAAERQGQDIGTLNGTLQTDIFKEYIAQKEWLFAPEPHLRLIGDLMEYCAEKIPAYKPTASPTWSSGSPAAWTSSSSRPVCPSSSTRTWTSSRRSRSSAPPAASGPAGCATSTARRRRRRSSCGSTPRPPASP
jgi:methylmalonyl-CoA mutase N-terminal domain/subunit